MKQRYALSTVLLNGLSLEAAIEKIVGAGFERVELKGDAGHLDNWIAHPAEARRALEAAGITVTTVHSPAAGCNNGSLDEAARLASVEAAAASFFQAAEVGAEAVICHPNVPQPPFTEETFEPIWTRSRKSFVALAERAEAASIKMAVENLPARGQPRPGSRISHILAMIEGLGDHVGICLDAGHSNANGMSAAEEVLEAGEKLFALHIQDNDGQGQDQHLLPGRGTTDWEAFLDALERIGFEGPRTFEVARGDEMDVLLAGLSVLRQEWEAR